NGKRTQFNSPKVRFTPEERLADMDAQGVDVQVVSIHTPFFGYHLDPAQGRQLAREVNDEIAAMTKQWPARFAGLATLPVQDVKAAVDELERAVTVLGLKGAELDTLVNGENWDEPKFLPLFKAAEAMGALLFFHPQPHHNFMMQRTTRYGLFNSLGVIVEDAIVVAVLIFGGFLDACPDLKVCIAHGGGPACFAMGRLDRGWQGTPVERRSIQQPPSGYQRRLYYDTVLGSEGFDVRRFSLVRPRVDWSGFLRERHAKAQLSDEQTAAIRWLAAQPRGPAKVLVISEDWSSDCRRDVPYLARLAEAGGLELRIFVRDGDTMLRKGLPAPSAGGNADLVLEYANEKNGERWATVPVAVFFTRDFVELYRYIEYPAIYRKDRVIGHLRAARAGETEEQTKARSGRDIAALLESPFFDVWARAGIGEILSALHERLVAAPPRG